MDLLTTILVLEMLVLIWLLTGIGNKVIELVKLCKEIQAEMVGKK